MPGERPSRILAVDDESVNIELIADIFEEEHAVLFAVNGGPGRHPVGRRAARNERL